MNASFLPHGAGWRNGNWIRSIFLVTVMAAAAIVLGAISSAQADPPPAAARPAPRDLFQNKLSDYTDKLDWDPEGRGPILIVAPNTTQPDFLTNFQRRIRWSRTISQEQTNGPLAKTDGNYRSAEVATYFGRKIVHLGTISVFAPDAMTQLKYDHLPKPDPYAGMSEFEKLQLLESTFTEGQWKQAAGADGLGLDDLAGRQKDIYLALLPEPFAVAHGTERSVGTSGEMVTIYDKSEPLTPEKRTQVRIQFSRKLDWDLIQNAMGNMSQTFPSVGTGTELSDTSFKYRVSNDNDPSNVSGSIYGANLLVVVPNRLKPSELPANWPALDTSIDIHDMATVGALVERIAQLTGAHLHCDPRYQNLDLLILGRSAKAIDRLQALSWAVTGTWRRLGEEFVLTDDLVGLGTRHAMIADWANENALLAERRNAAAMAALKKVDYRVIGWSATDPNRPSGALMAKIDDFEGRIGAGGDGARSLEIPETELPEAGQKLFQKQVARISAMLHPDLDGSRINQNLRRGFDRPIDSTTVRMGVCLQVACIVPGLGKMPQSNSGGNRNHPDLLGRPFDPWPQGKTMQSATSAHLLPGKPTPRAIRSNVTSAAELSSVARAAKAHGFSELWIAVSPDDTGLATTAVRVGKAEGLGVRAVIGLLRSPSVEGRAELEHNALGETISEYVHRWHAQLLTLLPSEQPIGPDLPSSASTIISRWTLPEAGAAFLAGGDCRVNTDGERRRLAAAAAKIAATPGILGLVLQDSAPPGFETLTPAEQGAYYGSPAYDPDRQLGYTEEERLDCLKQNDFDPIDLSPLAYGQMLLSVGRTGGGGGAHPLPLPFFSDFGAAATTPRVSGTLSAVTTAWTRWCKFRQQERQELVKSIVDKVAAPLPRAPVLVRQFDDPLLIRTNGYIVADSIVHAAVTPSGTTPPATPLMLTLATRIDPVAASGFYLLNSTVTSASGGIPTVAERLSALDSGLQQGANWGNVVLDVSDLSVSDALALLDKLPLVAAQVATITPRSADVAR